MALTTGSGHKLYFSATAPATFDQVGYEAVTGYELAPCAETLPELVKRFESVDFTCLYTGTTETARGVAEVIEFTPVIKDEPTNASQVLLQTAFDATNGSAAELITMKVEDAGAAQTFYAQAKVFGYGSGERVSGTVYMRVVELRIDAGTLVEVNA